MKFIPTDERNITDQDVFAALDLTLPQLAPIREALEKNDLPKAKEALIRHFETRTAPKYFFDYRTLPLEKINTDSLLCTARKDQ